MLKKKLTKLKIMYNKINILNYIYIYIYDIYLLRV